MHKHIFYYKRTHARPYTKNGIQQLYTLVQNAKDKSIPQSLSSSNRPHPVWQRVREYVWHHESSSTVWRMQRWGVYGYAADKSAAYSAGCRAKGAVVCHCWLHHVPELDSALWPYWGGLLCVRLTWLNFGACTPGPPIVWGMTSSGARPALCPGTSWFIKCGPVICLLGLVALNGHRPVSYHSFVWWGLPPFLC